MTWSTFTNWLSENRKHLPPSVAYDIATDGLNRLKQRMAEGRGDYPLTFDDLIRKGEDIISGIKR